MQRPYTEYKNKVIGKRIDADWSFGYQCTDLFKDYCNNVLDMNIKKSWNAKEIWTNTYNIFGKERMKWDWIKNLMQWDILVSNVWSNWHVAIFDRYVNWKIYVLEQNGSGVNSGDWLWPNAVRIHKYSPLFFYIVWRSIKIIENYTLELKYIENKLMNWSDKDTLDYLKSIRRK